MTSEEKALPRLSLADAKRVYAAVFPHMRSAHSATEWPEIHEEMQAVVDAPSDRKAADVIRWWGCWERDLSAIKAARLLREAAARLREER